MSHIEKLIAQETATFIATHSKSQQMAEKAKEHWLNGVPMHWMLDWGTAFPIFVAEAKGAQLTDMDGNIYDDFCLGDTGSMFGHSPEPIARALAEYGKRGLTYMLPTEDAVIAGELLAQCFGLPYWQACATATDANRYAIRWARAITGRKNILIFQGCYHGSAEDTFVRLKNDKPIHRPGLIGQVYDMTQHTKVVEFNDAAALEEALKNRDIACIITEPALTNIGMVLPKPGYLEDLQRLAKQYGTLLIIDETHTISAGYGGYTRTHGLKPDFLTVGKAIAGGVPAAVFGCTEEMAKEMARVQSENESGYSGMGTTLSANALAMRCIRVNLSEVMTEKSYQHMLPLSAYLAQSIDQEIKKHQLPWHVSNVGARAEFLCTKTPPQNGTEAQASMQGRLELAIHLYLINRGILIAPFHNMTLISPSTTQEQVDRLTSALADFMNGGRTDSIKQVFRQRT